MSTTGITHDKRVDGGLSLYFQLADGVDLNIIKTTQFKSNQIVVNFGTPQTAANTTARSLLGDLLETSTHKYPTQTALARQLSQLYGADIGTGVGRIGTMHAVRLKARFINDRYAYQGLLDDVIELIHEILFNPLIDNEAFDQPTFNLQRANLKSAIQSLDDDKQYYADTQLRQLYFDDHAIMRIPSFGRLQDLAQLNADNLVQVYRQMINQDRISIVVLGDVDERHVVDRFKQFNFTPRSVATCDFMYRQSVRETVAEKEEIQAINQSKLNFAFQLPVYLDDPEYYAAVVMNGILGGTPLSKLFVNVREKESLAYYASSRYHSFSGMVSIQTGIQNTNYVRAKQLINEQIEAVQAGDFSDQLLQEVKDSLINQYQASLDVAGTVAERRLMSGLIPRPEHDPVAQIEAVTTTQVVRVAAAMKLQAIYYLNGDLTRWTNIIMISMMKRSMTKN